MFGETELILNTHYKLTHVVYKQLPAFFENSIFSQPKFCNWFYAVYFLSPQRHSAFSPFFQHIRINKMVKNRIYGSNHIMALEELDRITVIAYFSYTERRA
jgi:hypothetical protein